MSLLVANGVITIQNASNVTKFTSADKLVYQRHSQTGTIDVGGYYPTQVDFYTLANNDFLVLSISINSTSGNSVTPILGKFIPANGTIILNMYGRQVGNFAAIDTDVLSSGLAGHYLTFKINKADIYGGFIGSDITANLTYRAKIYSFL